MAKVEKAPNNACTRLMGRYAVRVFRQFAWLEVGSGKMAFSRPAPPDRACRDHPRVTLTVSLPLQKEDTNE
jgi:hypothetical protein